MMSSENGILTSTDICKIIRECKKASVKSLKYAGLDVEMTQQTTEDHSTWAIVEPTKLATETKIDDNDNAEDHQLDLEDHILDDLEHLKLTDPLEYEKLILDGES